MLNNWTFIRYSGRPVHTDKWTSLRDVLEFLDDEYNHAGGSHDYAKMILHNGTVVVEKVGPLIDKYRSRKRALWSDVYAELNSLIDTEVPYEMERKQKNDR